MILPPPLLFSKLAFSFNFGSYAWIKLKHISLGSLKQSFIIKWPAINKKERGQLKNNTPLKYWKEEEYLGTKNEWKILKDKKLDNQIREWK